jgi:hypothetical protein
MRILLLVCVLVTIASARTITWTGAAGNSLWGFANNWDANIVPTAADDVTINPLGGGTITVSTPAAANSITLGGGSYNQVLNLLSSISVGSGGINVLKSGTLQVNGNNDLPLSSQGTVRIAALGAFIWQSGAVTGPGQYVVDPAAGFVFAGTALKLLSSANITAFGATTIQSTTIQFAKSSGLYLLGNTTAIGQINIITADSTANLLTVSGNFTYEGNANNQPLNFQVNTSFNTALNIISGGVQFSAQAVVNGNTIVPQGTTVTVQASPQLVFFRNVAGAGSFFVNSPTEVVTLSTSVVNLAASGSLTTTAASTAKSFVISGKLIIASSTFTTTDASLQAGTVTGAGKLVVLGNTEITSSSNGNNNNFISAEIQVQGRGYSTGAVNVLFADVGNLHILTTGSFTISATTTFAKQTGSPVVTNEGTFTVNLPTPGSIFTTGVDYRGANGVLVLNGGLVNFQGDTSLANKVTTTNVLIQFQTAVANWGPVSGTGSINVTAAPSAISTFGATQISYFGVVNGNVQVTSLSVATLELFNGVLTVGTGSHTGTIFNYYGGTLTTQKATLSTSTFNLYASTPATINGM